MSDPSGGAGKPKSEVEDETIQTKDSRKRKKGRSRPFSSILVVLLMCCGLCLAVTFLHGTVLHTTVHDQRQKLQLGGVVELPHGHGIRPVVHSDLRIAQLSCDDYGGPPQHIAQEMVYWQEIPSDSEYRSPFLQGSAKRYLTFEPDGGGWNNIRMAMETVLTMAHAMGRTLVLPPEQEMYLLKDKGDGGQRKAFSFNDFFPMDRISEEEKGLEIISMEQFLEREAMSGHLLDRSGEVSFPPNNRTNWNGMSKEVKFELNPWLQSVSFMPDWNFDKCLAAIPASSDPMDADEVTNIWEGIRRSGGFPPYESFVGNPTPVHASAADRLKENIMERKYLCVYNETLQHEPVIHFHGKKKLGARLLYHFYAALWFVDWRADLWTKRFVRDHIHYRDEIQCAAARIVSAVRDRARHRDSNNTHGLFDAFHIRRGDFQYKRTRVSAKEIYEISKDEIPEGATVYVGTDERDKTFFKDMAEHYDIVFLDDFKHLIKGLNTNFYGMIDQLVTSRSRVFFGCWFSTFTGYINRLRGYHSDVLKLPGFQSGIVESYYYVLPKFKYRMKEYWPISGASYSREFPVAWRNIDHGIGELPVSSQR